MFSNALPLLQQPGIFYYVQAPNHQPDYLAAAIEQFLLADKQRLEQLSSADFEQNKRSLINNLLQEDRRLGERSERLWREVGSQRQNFAHREQLAATLEPLSQQAFLKFYESLMERQRGFYLIATTPEQKNKPLPGAAVKTEEWTSH